MKHRLLSSLLFILVMATLSCARKSGGPASPEAVNFTFSPPEWQTAICLPDDPNKSLVDRTGELLYHYRQGGREFGTRIGVRVADSTVWIRQNLYSPRVPVVTTFLQSEGLEITQEAFADTEVRPAVVSENALTRTDEGGMLMNWANPPSGTDPSIKNIAVHMGGNIHYQMSVEKGAPRVIALVWCEGYWKEPGHRVQTLNVEGAERRTADVVAEAGPNQPVVFWFHATDVNGDGKINISVEAAPQAGDNNTAINGLWVFGAETRSENEALLSGNMDSKALATMHRVNQQGPGRDDIILVRVKNTGNQARMIQPQLLINTALPFSFLPDEQKAMINFLETVTASLRMSDIEDQGATGQSIRLEPVNIRPKQTVSFSIRYSNGTPRETRPDLSGPEVLAEDQTARKKAINFWEQGTSLPFDRIAVPDAATQALLESSIRNIWQAREIKDGLPVFQVGPTCYRGLWIVDGAFLLESAALLGAGEEARNGVAYELTLQKPDGRIESLAADYWKENGIVLWTCVRHARLTQDKAWLESVWPRLEKIAVYIKTLRRQTLENESPLDDGLNPAGTLDGGIGGTHDEYTNTYWNLAGLKAFIEAAVWLGKGEEAQSWQAEYDDFMSAFRKAEKRDMSKDPSGNPYLPILLGPAGKDQLPQRAQWAFCNAVYPGQIFPADDTLVSGNLAMLEATEREDMVYGTGWDATGIWNYFASFYGHAWLWQGNGPKAARVLRAFGNHASPTLVWREEQSLKGAPFKKVGDMPHNWASAEFIRLAIHLIALDRGDELHLFEGLPRGWTGPGMTTRLNGIATPFGALTLELKVAANGKSARLHIDPLSDASCTNILVHTNSWTGKADNQVIRLDPGIKNDLTILLGE